MSYQKQLQLASRLHPGTGRRWMFSFILLVGLLSASMQVALAQTSVLQGSLSVSSGTGSGERLPGASLNLTSTFRAQTARSTVTNDQGEYKFTDLAPGVYTLNVTLNGFKEHTETVRIDGAAATTKDIALEVADVAATVTVVEDGDGLNTNDTAPPVSFNQNKLETLPLVNERFQDAIPLVPGVVRGPDGLINLKGARSSQSGMIVDSANVNDPVTGESAINLPIEAVQSVEVLTNPYAAEYGEFTSGVTSVQTRSGSDKFRANATSFFPRLRRRGDSFVGIGAFTPRVTFSGPIIKDKLKFFQSFEYRFIRTPVENLPPLSRDTDLESFDSLTQLDWEIGGKDHLTATVSLFPEKLRHVGLNTFNHQEVTPNFKQRGFLVAINERRIINNKSVLESSFSIKQFDADVFPNSGIAPMNFAPDQNSGSFFNRQARRTKRYQALETYSFNGPNFAGSHFIKVGGGVSYVTFSGRNTSSTVRILRADGTRSQQFDYEGNGVLSRNKTQVLAYFQDKWTVNRRLTIDYGVRYDRDNILRENDISPRVGFAFLPVVDGRTIIRGGIGIFYDDINLNVATFDQLQDRTLTHFGADGLHPIGLPDLQRFEFTGAKLRTPRSVNWNIEFDREWLKNLFVRVGYQQRQARREFILNPIESAARGIIIGLDNSGSSRYRELEITARYKFRENDEFAASYVRSSSQGELNDFNSYFSNFQNPIIQANERSRLPWDVPNRFLFHGEVHVPYRITLIPVLDIRTGFPYSIIDENRNFVGPRNRAGRFPNFASLDLQILRTVSLPGRFNKYRVELGLKIFNLTNHFNPRDFQNNLASDNFGGFYNGVGRQFGTRITFVKK
ncbi:MAG: carboxypeptidase regulatory-like domain-containing protein [Pyrinomonadaceae bacterium]|nr:carboxypeptidase regulatory-like domain-containing protein [Pyrinomonadaceae bacterium]